MDLDSIGYNVPLNAYTKVNESNYEDWSFNNSTKVLSGELLPNVRFISSSGVTLGTITENKAEMSGDALVTFVSEHGLDAISKGVVPFKSAEASGKTLQVKIKANASGTYVMKATGGGYTITGISADGIDSPEVISPGVFNVTIPDANTRVFTITMTVSSTGMLYFMPSESGYSIVGLGDNSGGSCVTVLNLSHVCLSQRYDKDLDGDVYVSNVQVKDDDSTVKFYADEGVKIGTTSVDGKEVRMKIEGTTSNNTKLDQTVNWSGITGYGFFTMNFSGLNITQKCEMTSQAGYSVVGLGDYTTKAASYNNGVITFQCLDDGRDYTIQVKVRASSSGSHTITSPAQGGYSIVGLGTGSTTATATYENGTITFSCADTTNDYIVVVKVRADAKIWVYQKNTALSMASAGDDGTAAVTDSPYTERIRNWSFSTFREDYYPCDMGVLIPQDGSQIIIEIYVSSRSLSVPYTYDQANGELNYVKNESGSLIVRYIIDTSNLKTVIDLDDFDTNCNNVSMNSNYKNWAFTYDDKLLLGVPGINTLFKGTGIDLERKAYRGTFIIDEKTGFSVRNISSRDVSITGSADYRITENMENGAVKSISITVLGELTSGRINIYLDRNTVTLNVNKELLDVYGTKYDIPWTEDKYTAKYGEVVKLPTMTRDGVSMVDGKAWTASPLVEITEANKYTVSASDSSIIYLTPQFVSASLVKVTFTTSVGTYDNGQHLYVIDIQKSKGSRSFTNDSWTDYPTLVLQGVSGFLFSGYVDSNGVTRTPASITSESNDITLTAVMMPTFHNFTFNRDDTDHMEISATNDSSSSMLIVGSNNADLEHHSEISFIIKPTSGRTISINEINDWAYTRVEGADVITSNPVTSYFDQFGNNYSNENGGSLIYSIVWAYEGTYDMTHTQGYYTQYLINHSTSETYKNVGTTILTDPGSSYWKEYNMDSVLSYYYIKTASLTGSGTDGKLLLSVHKDYVKEGTNYVEMAWAKFTGLGEPEKLSDNRGYMYTFFLDQDIDLTAHTTVMSVNINFVVNGVLVTSGDMSAWGLTGDDRGTPYAYGNNVPMYEKVMFCSYDSTVSYSAPNFTIGNGTLQWYTDRACTKPLTEATHPPGGGSYYYYEFTAIEDITLYTTKNVVITTMYDNNGNMIRGFQLLRDQSNYDKITLPGIKAPLYGHLFIGWGIIENGKNIFSYAPNSTFDPGTNVNELKLYAYYLEGGSDQIIPYDGKQHIMDIVLCEEGGTYDKGTYKQSEAINTVVSPTCNEGVVTFTCPDNVSDYVLVVKVRASTEHSGDTHTLSAASNCSIVGIGEGSTATIVSYTSGTITFKCTEVADKYDTIVIKVRAISSSSSCTIGPVTGNCNIIGVTSASMVVRISDDQSKIAGDDPLPVLSITDFVDKTYYYRVKVISESGLVSEVTGSFKFEINKVELFVIAPSAVFVEGDGKNHFVTSSQVQIIATTAEGYVPNPSDIAGYVLDTEMAGYSDHIDQVGSVRTAASIYFVEGKADNYIIHYVDGSLILYPKESARYMVGGY